MRMRALVPGLLLVALASTALADLDAQCPPGWTEASRSSDLIIFYRDNAQANAREIKAYTEFDAPPAAVFKVITDFANYPQFMPYVKESTVLKRVSPTEVISYQHLSPPLVSDRDFILKIVSTGSGGVYESKWTPMPDYQPEQPGIVRVRINEGGWRLEPIDGGKRTRGIYSLLTSPGGSIPAWIANRSNTIAIPRLVKAIKGRLAATQP